MTFWEYLIIFNEYCRRTLLSAAHFRSAYSPLSAGARPVLKLEVVENFQNFTQKMFSGGDTKKQEREQVSNEK